jgi:hypothetical protein
MLDFYGMSIEELRAGETQCGWAAKDTARQIDSAIRRAVKEAYCAGVKDGYNNNVNQIALAAKYRVRL